MNSASAAALIWHMADCIEQGFEREMHSPTGSEKTGIQLSVLYRAVDRLSIVPATAALPIPGNLVQYPAYLVRVEGNSLMPDPEAAMIVDRLHLFPLAAGQLIVLPFGFQDQVRPVVQPDDEIRGILAHGSFVGVHDDKAQMVIFHPCGHVRASVQLPSRALFPAAVKHHMVDMRFSRELARLACNISFDCYSR